VGLGYFGLQFYFYIIFAFYNLTKKYLQASGFTREQLKYILVGCIVIAFFGSIFASFFLL